MKNLYILLILILLPWRIWAEDDALQIGYRIPATPLYLGGYFSTEYLRSPHRQIWDIDDAALMLYGEYDTFDLLSEFEIADLYKSEHGRLHHEQFNRTIHIERLYMTYYFDDLQSLRIGKFNTPVGYWNLVPINLFRETTSSPYLATAIFPKLTTGVDYHRTMRAGMLESLDLILQKNEDFDDTYNNFDSDSHYGVRFSFAQETLLWQFAAGTFRYHRFAYNYYLLGAFQLEGERMDWQVEAGVRRDPRRRWLHALYLQDVWHLGVHTDLVVRIEHYREEATDKIVMNALGGIVFRPNAKTALKAEFQTGRRFAPRTLLSISMIF